MTENTEQVYKRALSEMKKEQWLAAIKLLKREVAALQTKWRFSWNLGWCYFKLDKFDAARRHMIRAARLAPFLSQGKVVEAENVHLEGMRLKPKNSERYESYAAFLSDVGREAEAQTMNKKVRKLQCVN
jgi:Flp pilus assembly protein TadD